MKLLTIFTAPKPFTDPHIATIQRNAIQSWLHLGDEVDVILVGQEEGLGEVAAELGVKYLPEVARNQENTPLVNSIFDLARANSYSPLLAYLNADIMVTPDIVQISRQVASKSSHFLIVGQRWDLEITQTWDFSAGWDMRVLDKLNQHGQLHPPAGSDYFIFPRYLFFEMPEFAIGRAGWDNWMIYHALAQGWLVIDATRSLDIIHQNHDYRHLPGGVPHYDLEESDRNMELAGGWHHMYMVLDTNKELVNGKIRLPRPTLLRFLRKMEMWLLPKDGRRSGYRWALARKFRRRRRRLTGSLI